MEWSESVTVEAGMLRREEWGRCSLLSAGRMEAGKLEGQDGSHRPILFRREFNVEKSLRRLERIQKARLYISAGGVCKAEMNRQQIGDHVLTPG